MENKEHNVFLSFRKVALNGFFYGNAVWDVQVRSILSYRGYKQGDKILIHWDKDVEILTTSFVQGFFSELVKTIGIDGIISDVKIDGLKEYSKLDLVQDLYF